jgi:hypothetical protein
MTRPEVNIIVCVDARKCCWAESYGRTGEDLLAELRRTVHEEGLEEAVQVTPCQCIFGCTYGPRIDLVQRWSGEKILYGIGTGEVSITRRGKVSLREIPPSLPEMIRCNLPEASAGAD